MISVRAHAYKERDAHPQLSHREQQSRRTLIARGLGRASAAVGSGVALYFSYAPWGWWPLGLISFALLYAAYQPWGTVRISRVAGAVLGALHGLTLYLLLLPWVGEFVGAAPFIALAIANAVFLLGFGALAPGLGAWGWALWYGAVEWLHSTWPFGGFAWVRVAWSQVDSPLLTAAPVGGPAAVSFLTVLLGAALGEWLHRHRWRPPIALIAGIAVLLTGAAYGAHLRSASDVDTVRIAAVQGNVPRLGLDFNAQREAVLNNHVAETEHIAEPVDVVVWPENSSDVNPFAVPSARARIEGAAREVGAPILVGTLTRDEVGARNTVVVFNPDGTTGEYHHKKYLQPFGEYMPYRDFFRRFSAYVDQAGDFKPGTGSGVIHAAGIPVGVSTCYEVAFDASGRDAVRSGAQILSTPTNNATFGFTDMTYQQLAMSRFRARELDRAVVVAATSGVSAMVHPDGTVSQHTQIFEAAHLVDTLPLRTTVTLAARYGRQLETVLTIMGVLAAASGVMMQHHSRRPPARTRKRRETQP